MNYHRDFVVGKAMLQAWKVDADILVNIIGMSSKYYKISSIQGYDTTTGYLHKEDGPAIVYGDGTEEYWLVGVRFENKEEWERAKKLKGFL
jgi:hypothetical protein